MRGLKQKGFLMNNKLATIEKRIDNNQKLLLEQFRKVPIIQSACEKLNIGRATYYRWRAESSEFSKLSDEALLEGALLVNDVAESQLLSAIKDQNLTAIIFWLRSHHKAYANKIEINAPSDETAKLNQEQENLIKKALTILKQNKKVRKSKK